MNSGPRLGLNAGGRPQPVTRERGCPPEADCGKQRSRGPTRGAALGIWDGDDRRRGRGGPAPAQARLQPRTGAPPTSPPPRGPDAQPRRLRDGVAGVAEGPAALGIQAPAGQWVVELQALGQGAGRGKGPGPALPQAPGRQVPSASRLLLQGGGWHQPWRTAWVPGPSGAVRSDGCRGRGLPGSAPGRETGAAQSAGHLAARALVSHTPRVARSSRAGSLPGAGEDAESLAALCSITGQPGHGASTLTSREHPLGQLAVGVPGNGTGSRLVSWWPFPSAERPVAWTEGRSGRRWSPGSLRTVLLAWETPGTVLRAWV